MPSFVLCLLFVTTCGLWDREEIGPGEMSGPPLERNIQSAVPNLGPGGAWTHNTNHLRRLHLSWASLGQSKSSMDFLGENYLDGTSCACSLDSGLSSTIWNIMQISATVSALIRAGKQGGLFPSSTNGRPLRLSVAVQTWTNCAQWLIRDPQSVKVFGLLLSKLQLHTRH